MSIEISQHFGYKKLFRFTIPSIIMMIFTSLYNVVDGFFVSNYTGKTQFAAVNLIMPFLMVLGVIGFMVGTGGNALISKYFGEGNDKKARETFSLLVYFVIAVGVFTTVMGQLVLKKIVLLLGADEAMFGYCVKYGRIILISLTGFMLQNVFQSLLITAGKPKIGLFITIFAGVGNMVLDFVLVGILKLGLVGAACATVTAELTGGFVPLIYFCCKNSSTLRLGKTHFDFKAIVKTCTNGASEFMTNISMSVVNMMFNLQLMKFFGEDGVAAFGTIMYVNFVFVSAFIGYSIGCAPIVGYNFGAKNHNELQNIFRKSLVILSFTGVIIASASMLLAKPISSIYVGYDEGLIKLTVMAFRLFATSYLFAGFNIFASAFFTALNNGAISALISFLRTFLFEALSIFLLPLIFGKNAIWLSVTTAEIMAFSIAFVVTLLQNKNYHYIKRRG